MHQRQPALRLLTLTPLLWSLCSLYGCDAGLGPEDNPTTLVDSSGVTFPWTCNDRACQIGAPTLRSLPTMQCGGAPYEPGIGLQWGRFFEICQVCGDAGGWFTSVPRCRPVACTTDADCPQLYQYATEYRFRCQRGLCQASEGERAKLLSNRIVTLLCLAKLDRHDTQSSFDAAAITAQQVADASCPTDGTSCEVPTSCWQP